MELRSEVLGIPVLSATAGHVHCQFQPAPDSKLVKRSVPMVLDHWFAGADDLANVPICRLVKPSQTMTASFVNQIMCQRTRKPITYIK
jgi:hypothetical protein